MKKLILLVLVIALIPSSLGCTQKKDQLINKEINTIEAKGNLTEKDIEDCKEVVSRYFTALNNKDIAEINKTLGRYKKDLYTKNKIGKWNPNLISINHPGRYTKDNIPPTSYKANYGKDPYKSMSLHVTYRIDNETKDWDYILVKETETSPWQIHDWGY